MARPTAGVAPAEGRGEVVLYSSRHVGSLATPEPEELSRLVPIWRDRSLTLWAVPDHRLVLVFENRGEGVGGTLSHPRGQIYAFDHVPPLIGAPARRAAAAEAQGRLPAVRADRR